MLHLWQPHTAHVRHDRKFLASPGFVPSLLCTAARSRGYDGGRTLPSPPPPSPLAFATRGARHACARAESGSPRKLHCLHREKNWENSSTRTVGRSEKGFQSIFQLFFLRKKNLENVKKLTLHPEVPRTPRLRWYWFTNVYNRLPKFAASSRHELQKSLSRFLGGPPPPLPAIVFQPGWAGKTVSK